MMEINGHLMLHPQLLTLLSTVSAHFSAKGNGLNRALCFLCESYGGTYYGYPDSSALE
jgi:hypothetical protein